MIAGYGNNRLFYLLVAVALLLFTESAYAQTHGYGVVGATTTGSDAVKNGFRYSVGGGWAIAPRVLVGGEFGGLQKDGAGAIASGNIGVHFRRRVETGVDPFVTGGVSGVRFGGETGVFANIGGGINYWIGSHVGLRAEFRGYPSGKDLDGFSEVRVGIAFR